MYNDCDSFVPAFGDFQVHFTIDTMQGGQITVFITLIKLPRSYARQIYTVLSLAMSYLYRVWLMSHVQCPFPDKNALTAAKSGQNRLFVAHHSEGAKRGTSGADATAVLAVSSTNQIDRYVPRVASGRCPRSACASL